jgi:hypothetical protein
MTAQQQTPAEQPNGQPMPADTDAERGLLAGLLVYPEALDDVVEILRGEAKDFYTHEYRALYTALLALWRAGEPIDVVLVVDKLRQMGLLEEAGGVSGVSTVATAALPRDRIIPYAHLVRRHAQRRGDIQLSDFLAREAYTCDNDEAYAIVRRGVGEALGDSSSAAEDLPILTDEEAEALPPLKGILGDILFDESVSYLYGPSGRWKSFVALDWALSIATGRAWMGRPTVEGDVLYVCSEGARGIGKRITAWKRAHSVTGGTRLRILPLAIDLANAAQVAALPRRLDALDLHPALIVFDTLAASNSGDENTAENAARITAAARRVIRMYEGVCVLIVHHTGYDNTHMRGSTAFYSNADTVIRIEGGTDNRRIEPGEPITIISDKPKEGEPFHDITLTAERLTWADESGAIHASLVMTPCESNKAAKSLEKALTPQRKAALAALEAVGHSGLSANAWRAVAGLSHGAFFEAVKFFVNAQLVSIDASGNYICSPAGPVGPVRSGSGPAIPTQWSPVRSGVSIDTGRTGLVSGPRESDQANGGVSGQLHVMRHDGEAPR